jgi:hypothetical protein
MALEKKQAKAESHTTKAPKKQTMPQRKALAK